MSDSVIPSVKTPNKYWTLLSLTLWYPRHKLQMRIGLFFGAASLAGAFSGLLAYGIGFMSGMQGLLGWSWIFVSVIITPYTVVSSDALLKVLEGLATIAVGSLAFFSVS